MGKKEGHEQDLVHFLNDFLKTGDEDKIVKYLISNSDLPSPRANIEFASAFAEAVEIYSIQDPERLWNLCLKLIRILPHEAPTNNPMEFLPFCGAYAIGAIGSVSPEFFEKALSHLQELANDPRWRVREAVAMGVQKLLAKRGQRTLKALESWIDNNKWLAMRAAAAGVAEPTLLRIEQTARGALELHRKIFTMVLAAKERKSSEFKTMRKGLGYTLSVVVHAIPKDGFEYIHQLVNSQDPDILWIIMENLKKNRLVKNFPYEVASIKKLLE